MRYFVNGSLSTIKIYRRGKSRVPGFFSNCEYIGVDIAEGPGVDVVCKGQNLQYESAAFDVVVSCECFEHNPFWKETFTNMVRMLKPGGICLITCATLGRKEHGTKRTRYKKNTVQKEQILRPH